MKVNLDNFKQVGAVFSIVAATILLSVVSIFAQVNPLPTTPPANDIVMRDSFGQGPEMMRPASGKGTLKQTSLGVSMGGFWLEYPGDKTNRWITPDSGDTWRFCGTGPNPYELYSPLQTVFGFEQNGFLCTLLNAQIVSNTRPAALIALPSNLSTPYEVEIEAYYWRIPGGYVALGLTNSGATTNNLSTVGNLVLILKPNADNEFIMHYELRLGGVNGQLLNSGDADDNFFNQMKIRYNPQNRTVGASFNGIELGTFQGNFAPPKYAGFEGVGYADNFVVRKLQ